jgi:CubicO group peptidase (beta-lactamase class C family)
MRMADAERRIRRKGEDSGGTDGRGQDADRAGILIERVTGAPFAEVLAKRVFEPLGMTDTAFYVPAARLARFLPEVARDFWSAAYAALA